MAAVAAVTTIDPSGALIITEPPHAEVQSIGKHSCVLCITFKGRHRETNCSKSKEEEIEAMMVQHNQNKTEAETDCRRILLCSVIVTSKSALASQPPVT